MALIDVSELMLDPDFINAIIIVKRTPTINSYGENVLTEIQISAYGSVQSIGKDEAKRLPDGIRLSNFITVFTKTPLQEDAVGRYPDQVIWQGNRYNVYQCLPWDNFGAGWFMVDCQLEKATL